MQDNTAELSRPAAIRKNWSLTSYSGTVPWSALGGKSAVTEPPLLGVVTGTSLLGRRYWAVATRTSLLGRRYRDVVTGTSLLRRRYRDVVTGTSLPGRRYLDVVTGTSLLGRRYWDAVTGTPLPGRRYWDVVTGTSLLGRGCKRALSLITSRRADQDLLRFPADAERIYKASLLQSNSVARLVKDLCLLFNKLF